MSKRRDVKDKLVSAESDSKARLHVCASSNDSGDEGNQQTRIEPGLDPCLAFRMGLEMGRALAGKQQVSASAEGGGTAEDKQEAEQDPTASPHEPIDHKLSGSTGYAGNEQAKLSYFKSCHSSTDRPAARKSRSPKKAQSMPPSLDPCLKIHMSMNLVGEKAAREYLEWLFMNEETGELPPNSEERINQVLAQTLVQEAWERVSHH